MAYAEATRSPDPSTQNGAVLLSADGLLIGWGHNHFPKGVSEEHWFGEKAAKYARVVHAEVAAILDAAHSSRPLDGSTLVCPWAACSNCAKHIAAAGVSTLVRHPLGGDAALPHWHEDCLIGDDIFREAGVEIIELEPDREVAESFQLRRNGQVWQP